MREAITPPEMSHYEGYRFSPAVRAGGLLHLSGQLGLVELVPPRLGEGVAGQIAAVFELQAKVLAAAGKSFADVLDMHSFHVGDLPGQMAVFMAEIERRFEPPWPAWTAVEVAGLALPGARVELRMTALA